MNNAAATSANFQLNGGTYGITVMATTLDQNANFLSLQVLAAAGTTFLDISTQGPFDIPNVSGSEVDVLLARWHTNGCRVLSLPEGVYRFLVTGTLTAIFAAVARADF